MSNGIVESYLKQVAERHLQRRRERLEAVETVDQARLRQAEVRSIVADLLGPTPERTDLKATTVASRRKEGYEIEMLTYESMPGFVVTANLYLPLGRSGPHPAVVGLVGNVSEGKADPTMQRMGQMLARRGIAVLVFDPIGQGERIQFFDITLRRSLLGKSPRVEHTHLANTLFLMDEHLGMYMAWDAMRAMDLLATREDIDATRMGLSGTGNGATVARLMVCLDERPAAAAMVLRAGDLNPLAAQDAEGSLSGVLALGVAPVDAWSAFAPRPLLMAFAEKGEQGSPTLQALDELDAQYAHFPEGVKPRRFTVENETGFERSLRAQVADFFAEIFGLPEERVRETDTPADNESTLYATETGQVLTALGIPDLHTHLHRKLDDLPPPMYVPSSRQAAEKMQEELRDKIRVPLRMPDPQGEVSAEVESHGNDWGLAVEKGRLIVENGIYLPYSFYAEGGDGADARGARPVALAVHERGSAAIASQGALMTRLAAGGYHVMAIDVRGTGETTLEKGRFEGDPYERLLAGPEARWTRTALSLGVNLFGGRVFDVLRALEYLRTRWDVQKERISLVGVGRGALWSLYASALDTGVEQTVLLRGLSSYKCLVENRRNNLHFSLYLAGVLRSFDLPQVAACLAPRGLTLLNAVNQARQRLPLDGVEGGYSFAREVYKKFDARERFAVGTTDHLNATLGAILDAVGVEHEL